MDTQHGRQPCNLTDYTDGTLQQKYTAYTQANLGNLPKRYHNPALDPHSVNPLLEQIGEDLRSSSEETYMDASSALPYACVALGGHLIDALDERETHYEGWRHEKGKDQRLVNEGVDGFSQLYSTFIKQNSQMHR